MLFLGTFTQAGLTILGSAHSKESSTFFLNGHFHHWQKTEEEH
jgi:hypothetical protein